MDPVILKPANHSGACGITQSIQNISLQLSCEREIDPVFGLIVPGNRTAIAMHNSSVIADNVVNIAIATGLISKA